MVGLRVCKCIVSPVILSTGTLWLVQRLPARLPARSFSKKRKQKPKPIKLRWNIYSQRSAFLGWHRCRSPPQPSSKLNHCAASLVLSQIPPSLFLNGQCCEIKSSPENTPDFAIGMIRGRLARCKQGAKDTEFLLNTSILRGLLDWIDQLRWNGCLLIALAVSLAASLLKCQPLTAIVRWRFVSSLSF